MNVKVEKTEKNVVQLEIEVDAAKFEEGLQKSYVKNCKKFNIPGFRKGKAPRHIIERYYGVEVLFEDAINEVCPEVYDQAVEENGLHPVERPEIDIKEIGKGKNLVFTATVTVKPEVELGQYKGVEVEKVQAIVTEDDVQKELDKVAEKNARIITVEDRAVQTNDTAVIDFEGFIDGVAFEGGKGTDYPLVIGSGQFIPGFEEQLIGLKKDAEADINVNFPEEYGTSELAGKPALFKVKVKEIKMKELPALDDEFAKDVSEFDTLEEYKQDLRKKLTDEAEHKAKHETEDKVVEKIADNATVEIPEVMIERQIDNLVRDFDMRLRYQGLDLDRYMEIMGMDAQAFRGQFKTRAESEVKIQLVLEKIGKEEAITPEQEELDAEIARLAENYKQNAEDFKKHLRPDDIQYIKENVAIRKTVDFLVQNAKIA